MSFYNKNWETKLLKTVSKIQSLFKAEHAFGFWQIILVPTW